TLTPIAINVLLKGEYHAAPSIPDAAGRFARLHGHFERGFERLRQSYVEVLTALLSRRLIVPIVSTLVLALGGATFLFVGRDFFPAIDAAQIQLHVRAPPATRIEETERIFQAVEDRVRQIVL